jgi:hypothetical protein
MMKKYLLIVIVICLLCLEKIYAQTGKDNSGKISINAAQPDYKHIPEEANKLLESKLNQILTTYGIADNGYTERFVLTAKVNVVSKDIVPSTPQRISQKLEITFMVGDIIENKLYETTALSVSGIGINETKAFIAAFGNINANNEKIVALLDNATNKIIAYYTSNCDVIIEKAQSLANLQQYDEAIYNLVCVPNICSECYKKSQALASELFAKKIDLEGETLLKNAKIQWMQQPDKNGANQVAVLINQINPAAKCQPQVQKLISEISSKLKADEKRDWDFKVKQYEDEVKHQRDLTKAFQSIGEAWAKNSFNYMNIIRLW